MFIQAIHNITDTSLWTKRLADFEKQEPSPNFTLHCSGTSTDHAKAFCLWEAESVNALSTILDQATVGAAQNIYYTLDEKAPATRLPGSAVAR